VTTLNFCGALFGRTVLKFLKPFEARFCEPAANHYRLKVRPKLTHAAIRHQFCARHTWRLKIHRELLQPRNVLQRQSHTVYSVRATGFGDRCSNVVLVQGRRCNGRCNDCNNDCRMYSPLQYHVI